MTPIVLRRNAGFRLFVIALLRMIAATSITTAADDESAAARFSRDFHPDATWVCDANGTDQSAGRPLFALADELNVDVLAISTSHDVQWLALTVESASRPDSNLPRESKQQVWVCRTDGSDFRNLGPAISASLSPNGRRLVVERTVPEAGVWLLTNDPSPIVRSQRQQILDAEGHSAVWSSVGDQIAYIRRINEQEHLIAYDFAEDRFRSVVTFSSMELNSPSIAGWAIKGQCVFGAGMNAEGRPEPFLIDVDRGVRLPLPALPNSGAFEYSLSTDFGMVIGQVATGQSTNDWFQQVAVKLQGSDAALPNKSGTVTLSRSAASTLAGRRNHLPWFCEGNGHLYFISKPQTVEVN